jgi:HK97 gp10 family phage protein
MEVSVELKGLEGVEDALAEAGPKLARRALAKALKAAGAVLVREAKSRAPVAVKDTPQRRPGELRDAITAGPVRTSPKHERASLRVGPEIAAKDKEDSAQSPGVYGKFVEFGSIHNPNKKPFLRPAFDAAAQAALDAATDVLAAAVPELKQK